MGEEGLPHERLTSVNVYTCRIRNHTTRFILKCACTLGPEREGLTKQSGFFTRNLLFSQWDRKTTGFIAIGA